MHRREVLLGLAAAALPLRARAQTGPVFAAATIEGERHGIALLSRDGEILHHLLLPGRGHDVTASPDGRWIVAFARRPGTFALATSPAGDAPHVFTAPEGRHFYGHGVFSPDGRLLIATENDYENARGVLGLYDATDGFARIGEWDTHGIGPHDLNLMPDGRTLVVANGGMDTHPDYGREILNLPTMEPSVVFLDAGDGHLIERHTLPAAWSQHSTRHMDLLPDGSVFVGCQWQGAMADCPPMLLRFRKGEGQAAIGLGAEAEAAFRGYVGSVATNPGAGTVAITSPHGDVAAIVDGVSGKLLSLRHQADVCGVAWDGADFITSDGAGHFGARAHPGLVFDNHIFRL
ncbi:DUF1513 domain-containing protein [Palleronia sp.]|uniref:DUF1513 domain-containing protein n=1 Tax=Palleronia sp. TaxID=1940284 RepID=UPI0035C86F1F